MMFLFLMPSWIPQNTVDAIITDRNSILNTIVLRLPVFGLILAASLSGTTIDRRRKGWRKPGLADILLIPLVVALTLTTGWLVSEISENRIFFDANFICILIAYSWLSASMEELFFRSWILAEYIQAGVNPITLVLFSSLLFASLHIWQGWTVIFYSFAIGILYSLIFIRKGNLWILILAHGIHNSLALILPNVR